jgi:D-serine deaminase-like pyridoxal phosphate-dependent protein
VTVTVTVHSNVRTLPPQAAAMFAARAKGGSAGAGSGGGSPQGAGQGDAAGARPGGAGRSAGGDLSQMVARLPNKTIADLKVGDAVMIVASQPDPGSANVTAVTLLSGVEPILAAAPGAPAMTLSPWSLGGEAPEGGGGGGGH